MDDENRMIEMPFCRTLYIDGVGQLVMDRDERDGKPLLRLRCRVGKGDIMTTGIQMPCREAVAGGVILATITAMDEKRAKKVIHIMRSMDAELERTTKGAKWKYSTLDPATQDTSDTMEQLSCELDAVLLPEELRNAVDAAEAFADVMDNLFTSDEAANQSKH